MTKPKNIAEIVQPTESIKFEFVKAELKHNYIVHCYGDNPAWIINIIWASGGIVINDREGDKITIYAQYLKFNPNENTITIYFNQSYLEISDPNFGDNLNETITGMKYWLERLKDDRPVVRTSSLENSKTTEHN